MKKMIILLGPDNVGKTTIINNGFRTIVDYMPRLTASYKHFSAPLPNDPPRKQYIDYCEHLVETDKLTDYIYIDRAWPESKFYESYRRGKNDITMEECLDIEDRYLYFATERNYSPAMYIILKPWASIEKFHIDELLNKADQANESALLNNESLNLEDRQREHEEYYKFMMYYIEERSRICPDIANAFPINVMKVHNIDFSIL